MCRFGVEDTSRKSVRVLPRRGKQKKYGCLDHICVMRARVEPWTVFAPRVKLVKGFEHDRVRGGDVGRPRANTMTKLE
jgi:hypothetical protein